MTQVFIYGLIDPRTRMIRYVGKTTIGLDRPEQHRSAVAGHKGRWIQSLLLEGLNYEICILQEASLEGLNDAEVWWIAFGRACGWPLTNMTDGGDGLVSAEWTEERRQKLRDANLGKTASPEARERMSLARQVHLAKPGVREAIGDARRGQVMTQENKDKLILANLGRTHSEEHRASLRAAWARNPERRAIQAERMRKMRTQ